MTKFAQRLESKKRDAVQIYRARSTKGGAGCVARVWEGAVHFFRLTTVLL